MVVKTIYFVSFIDIFCVGLVVPLIGTSILENGGSVLLSGTTESICSGLQFINAPIVGSWSDTSGRKKVFMYILAMSILSNALLLVSPNFLTIFIFGQFINSAVHHVQVLIKAIVVDRIPEKERITVFSTTGALSGVAFTVAPILGGHLYSAYGDFFYIVIIVITLYLSCIGAVALLPESQPTTKSTKSERGVIQNIRRINWKLFGDVFLFKLTYELAFSFWRSVVAILMREVFDIRAKSSGYFVGYTNILVLLSNILLPFIQTNLYGDGQNNTKKIKLFLLVQGIILAVMALSESFPVFVVVCCPLMVSKILLDSLWMKILLDRIKNKDRGMIIGASDSILSLCNFVSPLTIGVVNQVFSLGVAQYLPLIALAVSVPIVEKLRN